MTIQCICDRSLSFAHNLIAPCLFVTLNRCVCDEYVCRACSFISLPKTMAFLVWLARNRIGASPKRYFPYSFDSLFIWLNSFGRYTSVLLTSSTLRLSSLLVYSVIVRYSSRYLSYCRFYNFSFSFALLLLLLFFLFSIQFQCSFLLFFFFIILIPFFGSFMRMTLFDKPNEIDGLSQREEKTYSKMCADGFCLWYCYCY